MSQRRCCRAPCARCQNVELQKVCKTLAERGFPDESIRHRMDVCRAAKDYLDYELSAPILNLTMASPSLLEKEKSLIEVRELRRRVVLAGGYVQSCARPEALEYVV